MKALNLIRLAVALAVGVGFTTGPSFASKAAKKHECSSCKHKHDCAECEKEDKK